MKFHYLPTPVQRALLIEETIARGKGANNLAFAYRIPFDVDLERFAQSVERVIGAAAPLADTFHRSGPGWVAYRSDHGPAVDRRTLDRFETAEAEEAWVVEDLGQQADVRLPPDRGPLFRLTILRGRFANYLTKLTSHLVTDSFTGYALTTAISGLYNGRDVDVLLERLGRGPDAFPAVDVDEAALGQIRRDLAGAHTMGTLSPDGQSLEAQQAGHFAEKRAGQDLFAQFQSSALVREFGTFPVLLAAHAKTCSVLGDRPEVVTSLPVANRRGVAQRGAAGFYVNSLLMHLAVDELSTAELVAAAAQRLRTLQRYQHLDLSRHLGSIAPELNSGFHPDNAFTAYKTAINFALDDVPTTLLAVPRRVVNRQLTVTVAIEDEDLVVEAGGSESVMVARPESLYLDNLRTLLDPSREHRRHLGAPRQDAAPIPRAAATQQLSVARRFREVANSRADRVALIDTTGARLTYGQLLARCEERAARFAQTASPAVMVSRPRGVERVISLLATQLAGRVHVPVEPKAPVARLDAIISTLTTEYGAEPFLDGSFETTPTKSWRTAWDVPADVGLIGPAPTDAYMLFTSGTSGTPKAIPISGRQVVQFIDSFVRAHEIDVDDRWLQFHSTVFDFSVLEILAPLLTGGSLLVVGDEEVLDPARMFNAAREHDVSVLCQTPSAIRRWRSAHIGDPRAYGWRLLLVGAEELTRPDLDVWFDAFGETARVFNLYGPTETTVAATSQEVRKNDPESLTRTGASIIGRELPGVQVRVVDRHGLEVPDGVEGELVITGAGVGRGYLADSPAGATRFEETSSLGMAYFSGDRARRYPDGALAYLGRRDGQAQIRGHRVEVGEVRHALLSLQGVRAAHVVAAPGGHGELQLVAFVTGDGLDIEHLRARLADHVPSYMVPGHIEHVPAFPMNFSGKVDEAALLRVFDERTKAKTAVTPAEVTLEQRVAQIFAETIGVPDLAPDVGFMEAGGTSMQLVAAHERLVAELQWDQLDLVDIFSAGTARHLASQFADAHSVGSER